MQFYLLSKRRAPFFCVVLFALVSSDAVVAAEWSIEPSVSLYEEYNDNVRFTTSPHPGVWQTTLSPSIKLSSKTEVSEVSGLAQLGVNRYTGDPQVEDSNDKLFSLRTSFQSERNAWAMNAGYKQDSTTESELLATGVVQTRTQRTVSSLNPSWTRTLTERSSFRLDYNYQDVKYGSHINLNDYTNQQASGTLQYQLTERDQVSLSVNHSVLEYAPISNTVILVNPPALGTDTTVNKSSSNNVQAGVTRLFSETLHGSLVLGLRSTVSSASHTCTSCFTQVGTPIAANETRGSGTSINATLEKAFESSKVSGFVSRETNPSGSGLVETDKLGVSLNRNLTENLTGSVDAISYHTKYISLAYPSSRYYTFEPKLNWRFTEWWTLDAGYRYGRFESGSIVNATTSNAVYLNLTYNWPKKAISL